MLDSYRISHEWLNTTCVEKHGFKYIIGLDYSFFDYSILFIVISCIFGCAFATTHINSYLARESTSPKRFLRTLIGFIIVAVFWTLVQTIDVDNFTTDFIVKKAMAHFIIGYFVYGVYPCTWEYLGFFEEQFETESEYSVTITHPDEHISEAQSENSYSMEGSKGKISLYAVTLYN